MTKEEHEKIQKDGANARAIGHTLRNPYYATERMPATTGEPVEEWQAKAQAWEMGWQLEHLLRS